MCRNSTDTRYFQRLRPYPRIHLLRSSIMFKDYDKTVRDERKGGVEKEKREKGGTGKKKKNSLSSIV